MRSIWQALLPRMGLCVGLCLSVWVEAGVSVGQVAPVVDLPLLSSGFQNTEEDTSGNMSLAALRGKVVYLDFWASWCGPCRMSFPQLEALRQELGPRGFEVLAVSVDELEADALQFLADIPVSYPVVLDEEGRTPRTYGILGMPTAYLIDREGVVRLVHQGFRKNDVAGLRLEIIKMLGNE